MISLIPAGIPSLFQTTFLQMRHIILIEIKKKYTTSGVLTLCHHFLLSRIFIQIVFFFYLPFPYRVLAIVASVSSDDLNIFFPSLTNTYMITTEKSFPTHKLVGNATRMEDVRGSEHQREREE